MPDSPASFDPYSPPQESGSVAITTRASVSSALALHSYGEAAYSETGVFSASDMSYAPSPDLRYRAAVGFWEFGRRAYGRPEPYVSSVSAQDSGQFEISIATVTGALAGIIRSDAQKTIMVRIRFVLDEKGSADFELVLNDYPEFPLLPLSEISFSLAGSTAPQYRGYVEYAPRRGTQNESGTREYVFRGFGLRKKLDRIKIPTGDETYASGVDVGEIVDDLVQRFVAEETTIIYNSSKINSATGTVTINSVQFGKQAISKAFDWCAKMANASWGVDGEGHFFFSVKSTTILDTFHVGYSVAQFEPEENWDKIANSVIAKRQSSVSSGGSGWTIAATAQDATSQAKYGLREIEIQLPGAITNEDAELVANRVLEDRKDPVFSGKITDRVVQSAADVLRSGRYRVIMSAMDYDATLQDADDHSEWSLTASGDTVLATDSIQYVTGAASIKLTFTYGFGDYIQAVVSSRPGRIKKIRFWTRSTEANILMAFGVGSGSWDTHTIDVSYGAANQWFLREWDVESLGLASIDRVGFKVNHSETGATPITVNLDAIDVIYSGNEAFRMELREAHYEFSPGGRLMKSAEFGQVRDRLYDYIGALIEDGKEIKAVQEIR